MRRLLHRLWCAVFGHHLVVQWSQMRLVCLRCPYKSRGFSLVYTQEIPLTPASDSWNEPLPPGAEAYTEIPDHARCRP